MKAFKLVLLGACLMGVLANAYADPIGFSALTYPEFSFIGTSGAVYSDTYKGYTNPSVWSGYYVGTIESSTGANDIGKLQTWISRYLYGTDTGFVASDFAKAEGSNSWSNGFLSVQLNSGGTSGTWSVTNATDALGFYAVKSTNAFALYYVIPSQTEGIWSTINIGTNPGSNQFGISHLSAAATGTNVPEPSTLLLIGTGILGLGLTGRKRFSK